MNNQDESICLLVSKNDPKTRSICQALAGEGITTLVKQKEGTDPDMSAAHWSGQPGQDLFFNSWKLLF